jgi:hypothetical protein
MALTFSYNNGDISDRGNWIVGEEITTSVFNELYGASLRADRWTQKSTNVKKDPYFDFYMKHNLVNIYKSESLTALYSGGDVSDDDGAEDTFFLDGATRNTCNTSSVSTSVGGYATIDNLDLTQFPDGSSSDTSDYIVYSERVNDVTKWDYMGIRIGTDASNYFYSYVYATYLDNGFNHRAVEKSDFNETGSPSWDDINYVAIRALSDDTVSAENEWITLIDIQMVRNDGDDFPNPIMRLDKDGALYSVDDNPVNYINLKQERGTLGFSRGSNGTTSAILKLTEKTVNSCYSQAIFRAGFDNEGLGLGFKIDTSNYINAYIDSGTFKLDVYEAGVLTDSDSQALTNTIQKFDIYRIALEILEDTVVAEITANGETHCLTAETSLTDEGHIVINQPTVDSFGIALDYSVSNERVEVQRYPQLILQRTYQSITTQEDTELTTILEPNKLYDIKLEMALRISSGTGNANVDWNTTGDIEQVTYRKTLGMAENETDPYGCTMRTGVHNLATDVTYGMTTSNTTIYESAVVKTGALGGRLTVRVAQDASETVIVNGLGSTLKVTEIKC